MKSFGCYCNIDVGGLPVTTQRKEGGASYKNEAASIFFWYDLQSGVKCFQFCSFLIRSDGNSTGHFILLLVGLTPLYIYNLKFLNCNKSVKREELQEEMLQKNSRTYQDTSATFGLPSLSGD